MDMKEEDEDSDDEEAMVASNNPQMSENDGDNVEEPQQQNNNASFSKRPTRSSSRRKRGEELRSKSTGVGISVMTTEPVNKKIVFGDDEDIAAAAEEEPKDEAVAEENEGSDDDEDDDAVEEVKGSTAKDLAQEQHELERATSRAVLTKKKSRKRKNKTQDADDFDDNFFKQLDEEREEQRKLLRKQKSKKQSEPVGRHTTFVVSGDEGEEFASSLTPKEVEHNIEVVVLGTARNDSSGDPNASFTGRSLLLEANKEAPSEAVLMFSRNSLLANGAEAPTSKQLHKAKISGHKTVQAPTWTRSKKVTRILATGTRQKGKAAAHFVVKM